MDVNIKVAVRVRPPTKREASEIFWETDGPMIAQKGATTKYAFDHVFSGDTSNVEVYEKSAQGIVLSVLKGFNGTVFAYGQTASGKTHTMMGEKGNEGVVPLAMQEVFNYIDQCSGREFLLRASYIEIYNEVIKDLLNPENKKLKIHENAQREVYIADCTEEILLSREMALDLIQRGEHNRHFGETNMNERSSRSHTIFTLVVESRLVDKRDSMSGAVNVAKLNLVDLAGSERASQTGAEGSRLKEGGFINKSLLFLGNVIQKLSEGDQGGYLSFRESKLTRILQTSLGGNARTGIICTVTPSSLDETHGTLRFASRAKTIKNKPEVNQVLSDQALLKLYKKEISGLKKELDSVRSESGIASLLCEKEQLAQELRDQDQARAKQLEEKEAKIAQLQKLILHCDSKKSSGKSKKSKVAPRRQTFAIGQLKYQELIDDDDDDDDDDNYDGVEKKEKFSSRSSLKGEHLISKTHVEPSSPQLADLSEYKQVADDTLLESNQVLQERVKALQEELERHDERWTKTLEDWKAKAQSMYFQQLEYSLAEKEAELKSELNEAAEKYKELMEAFSDKEIAVVSLTASLSAKEKSVGNLLAEKQSLSTLLDQMRASIVELEEKTSALEMELEKSRAVERVLVARDAGADEKEILVADLTKNLDALRKEKESAEDELKESFLAQLHVKEEKIMGLEYMIADLRKEIEALQEKDRQLEKEKESHAAQFHAKISELESMVADLREEMGAVQQEKKTLETQLHVKDEKISELESTKEKDIAKDRQLEKENESYVAQMRVKNENILELESMIAGLRERVDAVQKERNSVEDQIAEQKEFFTAQLRANEEQILELESIIADQKKKAESAEVQLRDEFEARARAKEEKCAELFEQKSSLECTMGAMQRELELLLEGKAESQAKFKKECHNMQAMIDVQSSTVTQLKDDNDFLNSQIKEMRRAQRAVEEKLAKAEEAESRLNRNLEELMEELAEKMNEIGELRQAQDETNETARREMAALQSKFNADIDELVQKHRAQLQSEKEKADEVLKAKTKENENYTGARVVEAVDVYIKRYEDMMNAMGDEWDREKDLLTTTIDKLEEEKIDTADKIEVLEAEIEGYSQFQVVLQRQNDKLIFQNKALKSKNEEMLKKISEGLDDSEARSKLERMRSELKGLMKENERLRKELAAGRSGQESGEGKVFFRHNTVSAVSEAAAYKLRKQLDLALDEKRALEATAKNLGTRLETEKMQGRLWRSKYEEATKFRSELMGRPEKGRDRENEFPLSSNRYP
ncbi:uncharacterized protein [Oscarella lobularis]|uniref:uncharacterized protein isoform X2 n=1 Tax=Oscarella lobularis TaxID=121494 RepID=UPI003313A2E1